jgi:hypothetical protein
VDNEFKGSRSSQTMEGAIYGQAAMSWNYRVMKDTYEGETFYEIHEVYYEGDGKVRNWTAEPVFPCGISVEELKEILKTMMEACDKPILEDIEGL